MRSTFKSIAVLLAVVGVVLVGANWAFAAGPFGGGPGMGMGVAQGGGHGGGHGIMAGGVVMDAAAEYIGISETALATERHDGKSLAQIAVAHGKSVDGLKLALVKAFKANLDAAVAAGRITQAQATQAVATFQSQLQALVDRTATGPMSGRGGGMGMGLGPCGSR